jgi:competence protein ComGC
MGLLGYFLSAFKSKSLVFLILVVLVIVYVLSIYLTMFEKEITIGQKYVRPAGRSTYYQIVDTEGNSYILGDSVFLLEFNSADDYAIIKEGKKYKVYVYWFRLPLMSWFPKIYKYSEI